MDNASFHKSKQLKIPKNIKIEYIPPYSPELNPQERRFEDIKKFLKNRIFLTFSLFSDEVSKLRIYGGFEEGINVFKGVLGNSHDIISLCL